MALIYTSLYIFIIWLSLAVTIGIFYCADLAEEHPTIFGVIIKYSIWGVLAIHLILFLEHLPYTYIVIGMAAHGCYYQLLKDYPRVQGITNPWLIASVVGMVIDNACWLYYFYMHYFTMMEILCFGQILLWLVPFLYMISLSVNDNVLPGLGAHGAGGGMGAQQGTQMSLKGLFNYFGFTSSRDKTKQQAAQFAAKPPTYNSAPNNSSNTNGYGGYGYNSGGAATYGGGSQQTSQVSHRSGGYSAATPQYSAPISGQAMPQGRKYD